MNLQFQRVVNLSKGIKWYVAPGVTSVSGICVRLLEENRTCEPW